MENRNVSVPDLTTLVIDVGAGVVTPQPARGQITGAISRPANPVITRGLLAGTPIRKAGLVERIPRSRKP